jgi:predicted nucleic acid-binding protein
VKYLIDTCVLSKLVKNTPDTQVLSWFGERQEQELCISTMTLAELQQGITRLPESKRRAELSRWLQQLEIGFAERILPFDKATASVWALMVVRAEATGKSMAAFDSIIAATALAQGCQLVTRNTRDFAHAGVALLNPWQKTVE